MTPNQLPMLSIQEELAQKGWSHVQTDINPSDKQSIRAMYSYVEPFLSTLDSPEPEYSLISPTIAGRSIAGSYEDMSFHTDNVYLDNPCRYVALFCIQQASDGGGNELLDGRTILKYISPDAIGALSEKTWSWQNPITNQASNEHRVISDGAESIRWWRMSLLAKNVGQLAIADEVEAAIGQSDARHSVCLKPGELLITDNRYMLHSRHKFVGERSLYRARFW